MTDYLTEQEQVEILKNWLKQYGFVILMGVLLAVVAVSGWRYWQQRQMKILLHASGVYDEMLTMRAQNDANATLVQAKKLFRHYPQTVYGQMAAFMLSRDALNKKNYQLSQEHLNWVIDHSKVPAFRDIARIRIARILIATQKPQDAIQLLAQVTDKQFSGLVNEIKGDAYLSLNDGGRARQYYQKALTELPNAEVVRPLLQMKYDNLATS